MKQHILDILIYYKTNKKINCIAACYFSWRTTQMEKYDRRCVCEKQHETQVRYISDTFLYVLTRTQKAEGSNRRGEEQI